MIIEKLTFPLQLAPLQPFPGTLEPLDFPLEPVLQILDPSPTNISIHHHQITTIKRYRYTTSERKLISILSFYSCFTFYVCLTFSLSFLILDSINS